MKAADLSAGHAGRGLWAVGWRGLGARWRGFGQMLAAGADALRWGVRRGDDPRLGTSWADGCRRARWLSDRRRRGRGSNHRAPGRAPWTALRCSPPERRCFYRPPWAAWSRWPGSSRNVNVREGRAAKAHRHGLSGLPRPGPGGPVGVVTASRAIQAEVRGAGAAGLRHLVVRVQKPGRVC